MITVQARKYDGFLRGVAGGLLSCLILLAPAHGAEIRISPMATLRAADVSSDHLAYVPAFEMLLTADQRKGEVCFHRVNWTTPSLTTIDAFPPTDLSKSVPIPGEATDIAVHPAQPLAMVLSRARQPRTRGEILLLDLRERSPGRLLRTQLVGFSPERIAITPDGSWAIISNSGRDHKKSPGSIGVMDLRQISGWEENRLQPMPYRELEGWTRLLGAPAEKLDPEAVAIEPRGRLGAVAVPAADAVLWVDFSGDQPQLAGTLKLPAKSRPASIALLNEPDGRLLLAVAEKESQSVSFYRVTRTPQPEAVLASRLDARPLVREDRPRKQRDPERIALFRPGMRTLALFSCARTDRLVLLDASDPAKPRLAHRLAGHSSPRDFFVAPTSAGLRLVTANGDGTISILRIEGTGD